MRLRWNYIVSKHILTLRICIVKLQACKTAYKNTGINDIKKKNVAIHNAPIHHTTFLEKGRSVWNRTNMEKLWEDTCSPEQQ